MGRKDSQYHTGVEPTPVLWHNAFSIGEDSRILESVNSLKSQNASIHPAT